MSKMSTPPENSTFTHRWAIIDFSKKLESSVEHPCITSLSFPSKSTYTKSPNKFCLSLFPRGINENSDFLSIGFGVVSLIENDEKITVRYRVSLINRKGERRNTKEWLYIFSCSKSVSVFGRFIARSELFCPSNGLLTGDNFIIHCEGTVLGEPTALDYANTNLADLKFIASSQPDLMVDMLFNLALNNRLTESDLVYPRDEVPNFEIQNQVEETFSYSYKASIREDEFSTWSQSKYMKSTLELKLLSRREMLDTLDYWMNSGKHVDLTLVIGHGHQEELWNLHSIVLLNRSSAFDSLLHSNIIVTDLEGQNSQISLPNATIDVFDQLILFLYTGKVPLLKEYPYELLTVSCEYDFDVLKQMCELSISTEITTENAIYLLILASAASGDLLKRAALKYITDHATELMFGFPESLKPELIEEMYRNLALKNVLKESEDRQVYDHFQPSIVSDVTEGNITCTHHKMHHLFNEFIYQDHLYYAPQYHSVESPEFWASENSSLKFKLSKYHRDGDGIVDRCFELMVKDDARRYVFSQPHVSLIRYKMTLCLLFGNESYVTLDTRHGVAYFKAFTKFTLLRVILLNSRDKLDYYYQNKDFSSMMYNPVMGTFKIRSEITIPLALSPIQGLTQLELEQSRKHLLKCINSSMLKSDDDKRDVTLVVRGTEFKVHRVFLTQSSVLAALITQSNRISIPELSIETFEPFVQYLYTGKVQSLDKYAAELLMVASKYKLELLLKMCQRVLNKSSSKSRFHK